MQIKKLSKGNILVSQPTLAEDLFYRTVILLADHNEEGSVGFILNKSLHFPVNLFVTELFSEAVVYQGGPVAKENLYYLHKRPDLISESYPICNGVFWSGEYEDVRNALNRGDIKKDEIRFYLGYTGWGKGQLQEEIDDKAWVVVNDKIDVFKDWTNDLWKQQMSKLGGEHLIWANSPIDPGLN